MPDITNDLLIQQLYVSYFNRPADPPGLTFWKSILQSGVSITSITNLFSASAEFNSIYSGTSIEKIGLLYKNMFNRTADFDGLLYWTNLLDSGLPFQQIVNAFSNASGGDRETFQARVGAAQKFTASIDTQEEILAYQGAKAAKIAKDWLASITDDASAQTAIGQLDTITLKIVEAAKPPGPTPPPAPAPAPPPPPQYSFTAQAGATPAALSFINSNVSNQTFSAISGLSPLNSSDTLNISFNNGGNSLDSSQTLNVGQLNLNSAGVVTLNTTNGVGSSGAATFSGFTDAGLTSLSITSPSSGPLTLGTITAGGFLTILNADNVGGFLTATFASGSFASSDIYQPNIRGALGGGDYNLGNPSVNIGIWLNGSTNIVRYASHTTAQQVYVRPGLTTNATIYGFGQGSTQDYLKIDGGGTAVVVLDNATHLNGVKIDIQGSGNLTIAGLKGGDDIWVDAPASLNATATGAWTPGSNTVNDGSAFIDANGYNIDLQNVNVISALGWTITNGGAAANLVGSSNGDQISGGSGADTINGAGGVDTVNYSSALKSGGSSLATSDIGITLTLNGSTVVTLNPGDTNAGADTLQNIENIIGTNGIDTITGDGNDNTISGGAGADTITGGAGADTIDGSGGDDTFVYASITDFIASNAIVDSIVGGNGTDTIRIDQASAFTIVNTDSFARAGTVEVLAVGAANTGDISITLNADAFAAGIRTVTLAGDTNSSGNNTINASSQSSGAISLALTGSAGQDALTGGAGADTITGGAGVDTTDGSGGDDTFVYASITDFIASNAIVDSIVGGNGTDTIRIDQASAFTIVNTDSFARAGTVEVLAVGAASTGDISITLNADAFAAGIRTVTLAGDTNSSGNNTINASSQSSGAISLALTGSAGQDAITGGAGTDTIYGNDGDDTIYGGAGNDSIAGNVGNDLIYGEDGIDSINGGQGNDAIYGGVGNDSIVGGSTGADILCGGDGLDTLTGDTEADIFLYTGNQASGMAQTGNAATGAIDVITDFATGVDKINLAWSGAFGGFAGGGQANSDYSSAYNHAAGRFTIQSGAVYIVEAYGSGSTWTSVLFARDQFTNPNPDGAIQIGTVGAYATSTNALAAIVSSDVIGAL